MPEELPKIFIEQVTLAGFRAFLSEQAISLYEGAPRNLTVFAANARGKSSIVDAIEFFFSSDGTLTRLGKIKSGNQAGREALDHVRAATAGVDSKVKISFREGAAPFDGERRTDHADQPRPAAANRALSDTRVRFLIRGYELRRFVEGQTPEERYSEVASWFSLTPLVEIQKALRDTRAKLKRTMERDPGTEERSRELRQLTDNAHTTWTEGIVATWFNSTFLDGLDATLQFDEIVVEGTKFEELSRKKQEEARRLGLELLNQLVAAVEALAGSEMIAGAITDFEHARRTLLDARAKEAEERAKAEKAVFREVWEASAKLFDSQPAEWNTCPVCETPFGDGPHQGKEGVHLHLTAGLQDLAQYRDAAAVVKAKTELAKNKWNDLKNGTTQLTSLLRAANQDTWIAQVGEYGRQIAELTRDVPLPDSAPIRAHLTAVRTELLERRRIILDGQGGKTYAVALERLKELAALKERFVFATARRTQLELVNAELLRVAAIVDGAIRGHIGGILDALKADTNAIYRAIQEPGAPVPEIHLVLPDAEDTNQKRLSLAVDFAANRMGVPPSGYLSDSQIHTLALSLRLAGIRLLNRRLPVIVLDDVVTSYDADHRRRIAQMIGNQLAGFQLLVVTHDERFFKFMRELLPEATWKFRRIQRLESSFGPRFEDHLTADQEIERRHADDTSAANEMRQAEEEWLRRTCRDFGVDVRIREPERAHDYERAELAMALAKLLKGLRLLPPVVAGTTNSFLATLQRGEVENFGSHFQDNPHAVGSVGDERTRWAEFTSVRQIFVCPRAGCNGKRFQRPGNLQPVCCRCQTPFAFSAA